MLNVELNTYQANFADLMKAHPGQYVVIHGTQVEHVSSSYESALTWAYDNFGLERFFVKRVSEDRDVAHFTRDLGECLP